MGGFQGALLLIFYYFGNYFSAKFFLSYMAERLFFKHTSDKKDIVQPEKPATPPLPKPQFIEDDLKVNPKPKMPVMKPNFESYKTNQKLNEIIKDETQLTLESMKNPPLPYT